MAQIMAITDGQMAVYIKKNEQVKESSCNFKYKSICKVVSDSGGNQFIKGGVSAGWRMKK